VTPEDRITVGSCGMLTDQRRHGGVLRHAGDPAVLCRGGRA